MRNGDTRIMGDNMFVDGLNCFCIRLNPADLQYKRNILPQLSIEYLKCDDKNIYSLIVISEYQSRIKWDIGVFNAEMFFVEWNWLRM